MKHSLIDILIRPGEFFQYAITEKESLKIPGLIVFALGIVSAVYAYLIGGLTGKMMAGLMPGMESIIAISTILDTLLGIFVLLGDMGWCILLLYPHCSRAKGYI